MNDLNHNDPNRKRGQVSVIGTGIRAQVCLRGHSHTARISQCTQACTSMHPCFVPRHAVKVIQGHRRQNLIRQDDSPDLHDDQVTERANQTTAG